MEGVLAQERPVVGDPLRHAGALPERARDAPQEEGEAHTERAVGERPHRVGEAPVGVARRRAEGLGVSSVRTRGAEDEDRHAH